MKNLLLFIAILSIIIIIGTCGDEISSESELPQEESITKSETTSSSSQEITLGTPIKIGNFVYQVNDFSFRKSIGDEFYQETADGIYLLVDISLKNVDSDSHILDGSLFSITDLNGAEYDYSIDGATALEMLGRKTLCLKQCQPNITTRGVLIFEVPQRGKYYLNLVSGFWGTKSARVLLSK